MKKHWYDYLWIASLAYLMLGFFNILFAWIGLLCFFIPLLIAIAGGGKGSATVTADAGSCSAFLAGNSDCHAKKIFRIG